MTVGTFTGRKGDPAFDKLFHSRPWLERWSRAPWRRGRHGFGFCSGWLGHLAVTAPCRKPEASSTPTSSALAGNQEADGQIAHGDQQVLSRCARDPRSVNAKVVPYVDVDLVSTTIAVCQVVVATLVIQGGDRFVRLFLRVDVLDGLRPGKPGRLEPEAFPDVARASPKKTMRPFPSRVRGSGGLDGASLPREPAETPDLVGERRPRDPLPSRRAPGD